MLLEHFFQPLLSAISWSENTKTLATESAENFVMQGGVKGMQHLERAVSNEWKKLQEFAPCVKCSSNLSDPNSSLYSATLRQSFTPAMEEHNQ